MRSGGDAGARLTLADLFACVAGAAGWTPRIFWHESTLTDALLTLAGFVMIHRPERFKKPYNLPDRRFLTEMIRKFPDLDFSHS